MPHGGQIRFDQTQHFNELRKHQNAATLGHQLGQQFKQSRAFGAVRHRARRVSLDQRRVAAHLPQLEQRIEHGNLRCGQTTGADRLAHPGIHGAAYGFIKRLLRL